MKPYLFQDTWPWEAVAGDNETVRILGIADDATGAMEVGAHFAAAGLRAQVVFDASARVDAEAVVIDTESRHVPAAEAEARVRRAADANVQWIFKKTDSTLRGNIAAEFRALLAAYPERALVYAPAYPALGRTVVNGELFVDGVRLAETAFARDALNPAREGFIPAVLAECGAAVEVVRDAGRLTATARIAVCDGRKDEDLERVAAALHEMGRPVLAAGPGAFARVWVRPFAREVRFAPPRAGRVLVVSGSRHPASIVQAARAAEAGWPLVAAPAAPEPDPAAVARRLAREAAARSFDTLVVFGGDTLSALLTELKIGIVEACGELLAGVPLARGRWQGGEVTLITKAGGFGPPDVLARIRQSLERTE